MMVFDGGGVEADNESSGGSFDNSSNLVFGN